MGLALLFPKQDALDPQQIRLLDRFYLHHNLNKAVMEATQAIFNRAKEFTVARLVANTRDSVEPVDTKQLDKAIRTAHMEVTKASEAAIMAAITSSVVDGAATTDINWPQEVVARPR